MDEIKKIIKTIAETHYKNEVFKKVVFKFEKEIIIKILKDDLLEEFFKIKSKDNFLTLQLIRDKEYFYFVIVKIKAIK